MKLSIKKIASTVAVTAALLMSGVGLVGAPAYATPKEEVCKGIAVLGECQDQPIQGVWDVAKEVINWILIIAGIVAVGFIIFAGIRYVTSAGNPDKVKKAKDTLLYAIIGLLIAALSLVIVNLVLGIGTEATDPIV